MSEAAAPTVMTAGGVSSSGTKQSKTPSMNGTSSSPDDGTSCGVTVMTAGVKSTSTAGSDFELVPLDQDRDEPNTQKQRVNSPSTGSIFRDGKYHDQDDDDEENEELEDGEQLKQSMKPDDLYNSTQMDVLPDSIDKEFDGNDPETLVKQKSKAHDMLWLALCFFGIMISFVLYGLLLEYTTSGGKHLHELSFLFVTSALYTMTAAAGRYVRDERPSSIPPAQFAVLAMMGMGSTFFSVRSLRYVIYPIQVLAKSCKPVPVMIMGAFLGKKYPVRKYINVVLIVGGVGLFMGGGGSGSKKHAASDEDDEMSSASKLFGIILLFVSLSFDGAIGAYEDKLMSVHHVGPFDLMYNIQLGKTIIAGVSLIVFNQVHIFIRMCQEMGFLLVALGLSGAAGQVFIFVTIAKFGALTCSIIGLARKITTLVASIYYYGHPVNAVQGTGLFISVGAMIMNFLGKSGKKGGHGHGGHGHGDKPAADSSEEEERQKMLDHDVTNSSKAADEEGGYELGAVKGNKAVV
mmetsp:Transcript_11206/g.15525  ORF Transcript_11206/g.15525 Transcript_11206/m.15525 type:complete len:518 (-) Transcript_11206:148-1701(-)